MTKFEFSENLNFLAAGVRQSLDTKTIETYYAMLGDLPSDTFRDACRVVLLTHKYANLPSIAELREAAVSVSKAFDQQLTAGEAWAIASDAATKIDLDIVGPYRVKIGREWKEYESQADAVLESVPHSVASAMMTFGLSSICGATGPEGVVRAQFTKVFEQLEERNKRIALLPPDLREFLENKRANTMLDKALAGLGDMPK